MEKNISYPFERNRYFYGKMLTARDFETEQNYFNSKRRLLNRAFFGAGVVCGLGVYQNDDASFSVETGLALDYSGREIVIPSPVIKKLSMIPGYEKLGDSKSSYLCLKYAQTPREPVNNIGAADSEGSQYNKVEEGYRLYLSTDEPEAEHIFGGSEQCDVRMIYCDNGVRIIRIVPKLALSGDEIGIRFVILKDFDGQPVSFTYSFESEYFRTDEDNSVKLYFTEESDKRADVFNAEYVLRTAFIQDAPVPLYDGACTLSVMIGDLIDKAELTDAPEIYLCRDSDSFSLMRDTRMSTLENHISGENTPIYLAKIDCMNIGTGHVIRHITALPFGQRISGPGSVETKVYTAVAPPAAESGQTPAPPAKDSFLKGGVTAETEVLEYWQKPQVSVNYSRRNKSMSFHFGIPSTEAYDYATSSGIAEVPISGAIRVNARFFSEEIPHNLGIGDVCITLSVEYNDNNERMLLFGDGEIFAAKGESRFVPRVEAAALLNPNTGKFRIGLHLSDYVEGSSIRVRWFAYKPTRDTAAMRSDENISIKITPSVIKLGTLERYRFKAEVDGSADESVVWSVVDQDGGFIDENGLYQAPSAAGTFEIVARSTANSAVKASAFVMIEE